MLQKLPDHRLVQIRLNYLDLNLLPQYVFFLHNFPSHLKTGLLKLSISHFINIIVL